MLDIPAQRQSSRRGTSRGREAGEEQQEATTNGRGQGKVVRGKAEKPLRGKQGWVCQAAWAKFRPGQCACACVHACVRLRVCGGCRQQVHAWRPGLLPATGQLGPSLTTVGPAAAPPMPWTRRPRTAIAPTSSGWLQAYRAGTSRVPLRRWLQSGSQWRPAACRG